MATRTVLLGVYTTLAAFACTARDREPGPLDSAGMSESPAPVWDVVPDSFGPVPLGVPLAQAAAALRDSIPLDFSMSDECAQVRTPSMPTGTSLMIIRDSVGAPAGVERADIDTLGIRTREGVGVGDSEEHVLSVYAGRVRVQPHKYTGPEGHYLVVTSPRDSAFAIIFETDGKRVLRYRAGRRPAVEYVEGCA